MGRIAVFIRPADHQVYRLPLAVCLIAHLLLPVPAHADKLIRGKIEYVHDGDTIHIRHRGRIVRIRLWGVDARELSTPAGRKARDWAVRQWEGRKAVCEPLGRSYRRVVARCHVDGVDIGQRLIVSGYGCEWRRFSKGYYRQPQHMLCEARWRKK